MLSERLVASDWECQLIYPSPGDWRSPGPGDWGGGYGGMSVSSGQFSRSCSYLTLSLVLSIPISILISHSSAVFFWAC
jgi:hypothetical protein